MDANEGARGYAKVALEHRIEMALRGKARRIGDCGYAVLAAGEQLAGVLDSPREDVLQRAVSGCALEAAQEMEA